jgi:hypothetical protein
MQDLQIVHTNSGRCEGVFKIAPLRYLMVLSIFSVIIEFMKVFGKKHLLLDEMSQENFCEKMESCKIVEG